MIRGKIIPAIKQVISNMFDEGEREDDALNKSIQNLEREVERYSKTTMELKIQADKHDHALNNLVKVLEECGGRRDLK